MDDAPTASPHPRRFPLGPALGLLIGGLGGVLLAARFAPDAWPRFEARSDALVERGASATAVRERVSARWARGHTGAEIVTEARRRLRAELAAAVPAGPLPPLAPSAAAAARLRGMATALRGLEREIAGTELGGGPGTAGGADRALAPIRDAAVAGDVPQLDVAIATDLAAWNRALDERVAGLDPRDRRLVWSDWREQLRTRATALEFIADEREAAEAPPVREAIARNAALRALLFESRIPDPVSRLTRFPAAPARIEVAPLPGFWAGAAALGGVLGLAVAFAAAAPARRRRRFPLLDPSAARPSDPGDRLHLVIGSDRGRVRRAVLELAAHPLAARGRTVVVDASRRARLHELLGLSPRLGFAECAERGLPALGLVQAGSFSGLFLLSRGRRGAIRQWLALDRVIEEVRPHFDRVIVVLDGDPPAVVGGVLAGRVLRAWWAGPGTARGRNAGRIADRLAIVPHDMHLETIPQATLEAFERRLGALAGAVSLEPLPAAGGFSEPGGFRVSPPAVLDCDLQIRQKLRFLAWMRRMHTERESTTGVGER